MLMTSFLFLGPWAEYVQDTPTTQNVREWECRRKARDVAWQQPLVTTFENSQWQLNDFDLQPGRSVLKSHKHCDFMADEFLYLVNLAIFFSFFSFPIVQDTIHADFSEAFVQLATHHHRQKNNLPTRITSVHRTYCGSCHVEQRKALCMLLFLQIDCFVFCIRPVAMVFTYPTFVRYSDDPKAVVANLTVSFCLTLHIGRHYCRRLNLRQIRLSAKPFFVLV